MSELIVCREAPWHAGLRAARAHLAPGLALQACALALVLAYYFHAPTHAAFDALAAFRVRTGWSYGIVATGFFGGLLPFIYLKLHPASRGRYVWSQGALLMAFWAYKGFEVDLWYRLLNAVIGPSHDVATIAIKTCLDQFVYCPLFAVPVTTLVYAWCEARFDTAAVWADARTRGWYGRRVLPMLIGNLGVWVPTVCIIYALPLPLQLPLFNLVLCFFTLMLAHMSQREEPPGR
ncbi:MAG: hypothetical protein KGJ37_02765 [Verrucomicrobiota bacterium]|nr:hypothetical protein [Verrucomicrobiota bacterium]